MKTPARLALLTTMTLLPFSAGSPFAAPRVSAPLVRFGSSNASGDLSYSDSYDGTFSAEVALTGLRPSAVYALTLNGKPDKPGNEELSRVGKTVATGGGREGYLDFQMIRTDAQGRFRGRTTEVPLSPGRYDVKFFVKDVERNWQVVLGLDILQFSVQAPPKRGVPQIRITRIVPNGQIEGIVGGLTGDPKKYKVLVYVRTDKWYIHPFTHGGEGYSFASVNTDGTWKIKTVKREFAADEVMALLVDAAYQPPATIDNIDRIGAVATHGEPGQGRL